MLVLPLAIQDLLESGRFAIRHMIRFELGSGPGGVWNDAYTVSYGGISYAPLAGNMSISEIPASSDLDSDRVRVTVSNLSNQVTTIIATEQWHQKPCILYLAFLDDARAVQHVIPRFSGILDDVEISDGANETATITLTIESNARELSRSNGSTRGDATQRLRSATDGIYKHAANASVDNDIYWGRKGPQYPAKT